jgi:enterobacterial common antigen flippase
VAGPPKSYHQILKSSFVVGGASFINILIGVVRTKVLAVLLGPAGVGVLGIYNSVVQTASALAGLGIGRSGVRQIAESSAEGDAPRSARAAAATLRWSLLLGVVGGCAVILLRGPIAHFMSLKVRPTNEIGWLGLAVAAAVLSAGQLAVIQGTRHVRFLAQQTVVGASLGTLVSLPIVYRYGSGGILWVVIAVALIGLASSWFFMRKVPLPVVTLRWQDYWSEGRTLIKLGAILMTTGLLSTGTLLLVRTFVSRQAGEAAAGYFQAAFAISVTYLDFVLQSMAADFYPRLTAAGRDHEACNRLINEQMEIALLMAAPLILGMLAFSQVVIHMLYSGSFEPACELLRWQMLGSLLKVTAWPIGFIFLAKNQGMRFFACELLWNSTYLGSIVFGLQRFGLIITGTGFFAAYALLLIWTLTLAARSTGFRPSSENQVLLLTFSTGCALIFFLSRATPSPLYYALSGLIVVACGCWSAKKLYQVVGADRIKSLARKFAGRQ